MSLTPNQANMIVAYQEQHPGTSASDAAVALGLPPLMVPAAASPTGRPLDPASREGRLLAEAAAINAAKESQKAKADAARTVYEANGVDCSQFTDAEMIDFALGKGDEPPVENTVAANVAAVQGGDPA